jgi:hypothetical protein
MPVLMGAVHVIVALTYKLAVIIGASGECGTVIPPWTVEITSSDH